MEVVNEDEGEFEEPPASEPDPETEIPEYGPEEVPNEADDPDFVGPLPTDKEYTAEELRQMKEEIEAWGLEGTTDNPDATWGRYPIGDGGSFDLNPDEVMAPIDEDGTPAGQDDDFGFGGLH